MEQLKKSFVSSVRNRCRHMVVAAALLVGGTSTANAAINFLTINMNFSTYVLTLGVSATCPYSSIHMYGIADYVGYWNKNGSTTNNNYGVASQPGGFAFYFQTGQMCVAGVPSTVTVNAPLSGLAGMSPTTVLTLGGATANFVGQGGAYDNMNMLILPDTYVVYNWNDGAGDHGYGVGPMSYTTTAVNGAQITAFGGYVYPFSSNNAYTIGY